VAAVIIWPLQFLQTPQFAEPFFRWGAVTTPVASATAAMDSGAAWALSLRFDRGAARGQFGPRILPKPGLLAAGLPTAVRAFSGGSRGGYCITISRKFFSRLPAFPARRSETSRLPKSVLPLAQSVMRSLHRMVSRSLRAVPGALASLPAPTRVPDLAGAQSPGTEHVPGGRYPTLSCTAGQLSAELRLKHKLRASPVCGVSSESP
jgi:hypothetical protein